MDTATFMKQRGIGISFAWCSLTVGATLARAADMSADPGAMKAVKAAEDARFAAMIKRDVKYLDGVLAKNLTYCHSTGECDNKQNFLDGIEGGRLRYLAIEPSNATARNFNGTVIGNGEAKVTVVMQGKQQTIHIVYTDVYVQVDGHWQLAAWQSTRIPDRPTK